MSIADDSTVVRLAAEILRHYAERHPGEWPQIKLEDGSILFLDIGSPESETDPDFDF